MQRLTCNTLVLGAGPGGYVAAIRAGQLGLDTIIVEAATPGGTCLNVGCIPSKALIHVAEEFERAVAFSAKSPLGISASRPKLDLKKTIAWKDDIISRLTSGVESLLKKAKVRSVRGWGRLVDGKTCHVTAAEGDVTISAENIVIATGSVPIEVPALPFGGKVISSTEALSLSRLPDQLAVVGAGYIGLELGIAFAKLGSKVTVVEAGDRILPHYDRELTRPISANLKQLGIEVLLNSTARGLSDNSNDLVAVDAEGTASVLKADKILVTVGRRPNTDDWGLDQLDLSRDGQFIAIDRQCRTSMTGVYAIGDVTGNPMLAHRAMAQGDLVAERIAGRSAAWDKVSIPAICFTDPELVTTGLSPEEAEAAGHEIKIGKFPFQANGRAMTTGHEAGFVRVVARAENHVVLGIQAVGSNVSELSSQFSLALEMGSRLEDIAATVHAHPTRGEAVQEAALGAMGHALHI